MKGIIVISFVLLVSSCQADHTENGQAVPAQKAEQIKALIKKYDLPDTIFRPGSPEAVEKVDLAELEANLEAWKAFRDSMDLQKTLSRQLEEEMKSVTTAEEFDALRKKYPGFFIGYDDSSSVKK